MGIRLENESIIELFIFLGLPFAAFIEVFFLLSQRKYPSAPNLLDSVSRLASTCARHMNLPQLTPLISSSNSHPAPHHHRRRTARPATHSSSLNIRPSALMTRSVVVTPVYRTAANTPLTDQTATSDDKTKSKSSKQSTKSVFPLFFDVL